MKRWVRRSLAVAAGLASIAASTVAVVGASSHAAGAVTPLDETVVVDSRNPAGASSTASLSPGTKYSLTVTGTYTYGKSLRQQPKSGVADAECSNLPPDTNYQRNRYLLLQPGGDLLDLYVNDAAVEWQPMTPTALGCAGDAEHTYSLVFSPTEAGPVTFSVHDTGNNNNVGALTVHIEERADVLIETLGLNSKWRSGITSTTTLDPTKSYRLEASGTYSFGTPAMLADAECSGVSGVAMSQTLFGPVLTPLDTGDDILDVYVNGVQRDWVAKTPGPTNCDDANHVYDLDFTPPANQRLNFKVQDTNYGDNFGTLTIKIFEILTAPPTPPQTGLPRIKLNEQVDVPGNARNGVNSTLPLLAGQSYLLEAEGTYTWGSGQQGDALCSTTTSDPTWASGRTFPGVTDPDVLTLLVNGSGASWIATNESPAGSGCDSDSHTYRLVFVPDTTGTVNFKVDDAYYGDNTGSLTVTIHRIDEIPIGAVLVNSMTADGMNSIPLAQGNDYRFNASGLYSYWKTQAAAFADAECSQAGFSPYNDFSYQPNRFGSGDPLDLYVNLHEVTWQPDSGSASGCDPNHVYNLIFTAPATGVINFKINDSPRNYADNSGSLTVQIYLEAS